MAKITMFMLCDSVENLLFPQSGPVQKLVSPQMCLRPLFIPGNFSFGIAVGVQGVDMRTSTKVQFTISDPDGTLVQDSGISELPPIPENVPEFLPKEYQGFLMNMDIRNMAIPKQGEYVFSAYIDEELIGTQVIPIFQGKK